MLSIDETIENVEKLYQSVTGRPAPQPDGPYAPIPAEKDPVEHIEEQLSRLLSAVGETVESEQEAQRVVWSPPVSIWEIDKEVVIAFEVPGVPRESVQVTLQGDVLTVQGERPERRESKLRVSERPLGRFRRNVTLSSAPRENEPSAEMKDGILEVRIPRDGREASGAHEIKIR
jgi:HSP20 family protein